ncbi:MAG: carbohydrate ABC transporter permease [Armatimonadota bacterium]
MQSTTVRSKESVRRSRLRQLQGACFALPAVIGLLWFTAYPVLASLYYSFCNYAVLKPPKWIGGANYAHLLEDPLFFTALWNTVFYAVFAVPLGICMALSLALLLNTKVRGLAFYRTCFYVPSVVPIVASAMLWIWLLNPDSGAINDLLRLVGVPSKYLPGWLQSPEWSKPAFILWSTWNVGGAMVIFLAALQDVPKELHEAAGLDGARKWDVFRHVTVPFISPQVLFTVVMGLIGAFQFFTPVYVMTNGEGGPVDSTTLYSLYMFNVAFSDFKMGYACAMAWVLLLIVLAATLFVMKSSARHIHYQGGEPNA